MKDTRPEKGFGPPLHLVRFPPATGVIALFSLYRNQRLSTPEALLDGSKKFLEGALSGTFSSAHAFCTPHILAQVVLIRGLF